MYEKNISAKQCKYEEGNQHSSETDDSIIKCHKQDLTIYSKGLNVVKSKQKKQSVNNFKLYPTDTQP